MINAIYYIGVIFEMCGTLVGIGIYTLFYSTFVNSNEDDCTDNNRVYDKEKVC